LPPRNHEPRVLQVVLSLNPGGTERLVVEIATRLHPVTPMAVCCLDEEGAWAAELADHGIQVTALRRQGGFRPGLGRGIADAARQHQADVLHCHHYSPFVYGCVARLWCPALRIIFTEHGRLSDMAPSPKRRLANRILGRIPHEVYTVSGDLRRHLVDEGFSPRAVGIIYNGIDVGSVPSEAGRAHVRGMLATPAETLVIGTIARLDPVKDLGTLIRATAAIAQRIPVTVIVLGEGPERRALEHLAMELGVARHITFLGHRDDARQWLAGCDVYANSSISEGVSLTILEAMAAALPVVATRVGGTPEIVDSACGRLIPARDPSALARSLLMLAQDRELRAALGAAARRRVEERFTLDRMVQEYREAYGRVS